MSNLDLKILCDHAVQIAYEAGDIIMEFYKNGANEMIKSDGSDVTEADLAADKCINEKLKELTPDIPVVSEESIEAGIKPDVSGGRYWMCDPLDGTISFIQRKDSFCVLISLIDNFQPVIGIAYYPVRNQALYAIKGQGCFEKCRDTGKTRQLQTSKPKHEYPITVCSPNHNKEENFIARTPDIPEKFRKFTDDFSIRDLLYGSIDIVVFTNPGGGEWDMAAFDVILTEAGGYLNASLQYGDITQKIQCSSVHAHPSTKDFVLPPH